MKTVTIALITLFANQSFAFGVCGDVESVGIQCFTSGKSSTTLVCQKNPRNGVVQCMKLSQ